MDGYTVVYCLIGGALVMAGVLIILEWLWPVPPVPPVEDYEQHWARVDERRGR